MSMKILLVLASLFICTLAFAQTFSSGPEKVSLIELYTSEGCSSCPPAEAWLNSLRKNDGLWKKFIPIAFHVTYWNYLGWTDATAQDAFNDRQRKYAASWGSGSVYTPCFIRNGEEWHRNGALASDSEKPGTLTVKKTADNTVEVTFQTSNKVAYEVHIAQIGGGIETKIRAGENAGRSLRHDFVAMSLQTVPLQTGESYTARLPLPESPKNALPENGLVAWVTKAGDLRPLQATGGFVSK